MKSAWEALHGCVWEWYVQHLTLDSYFADGPAFHAEIERLLCALAEHDRATALHAQRVARYAEWLGQGLDLDRSAAEQLHVAALLHDVGKLCVPRHLLSKTERLQEAEYRLVQEHPTFGERLVRALTPCPAVQQAVRWHHERPDGQGYPDRLQGDVIPLFARAIAVAEVFDTLICPRPPARGLSCPEAFAELRRAAGAQFDPALVECFADMLRRHADRGAYAPPRAGSHAAC